MSELFRTNGKGRTRSLATVVALLALSVGVYAAVSESPAVAVAPDITAPERVYTGINEMIEFKNEVDPISDDNRTIAVDLAIGATCVNNPDNAMYDIDDCARVQLTFQGSLAQGQLFIPNLTAKLTPTNTPVAVSPGGGLIDQMTNQPNQPGFVYHIAGNEDQINDTLNTLQFLPGTGYEDNLDVNVPPRLEVVGINGDPVGDITEAEIEIKVEGDNEEPTLTVPGTPTDAAVDTEQQYPSMLLGNQLDPTNRLANAVDPEMCNLTFCGAPYTNPGGIESDDKMLLIAWLDPTCGQFHLRGGAFTTIGGTTNSTVPLLLTNAPEGLGLEPDQAAAIQATLSLQAQTVDLTLQSSSETDLTNAWAGVGGISEVRYALSQITYKSPSDLGTCELNVAITDLGNSGMPALQGYVGSPIGGTAMPQPGYEIPDAKSDEGVIVFNVKDTHPHVTVNQTAQGPGFDPTNQPAVFTATFSETVDGLTSANLDISGTSGALETDAQVTPAGPSDTYTITVTPPSDGTVIVSIPADEVHANAGPMDSTTTNKASTSSDNTVTYDITDPTPTITVAVGQPDPTSTAPIQFTVDFNEDVNPLTFTGTDISFTGSTAGGTLTAFVTPVDAQTFDVAVAGMTTPDGEVVASVSSGGILDLAGNSNSASGTASVTWDDQNDNTKPDVTINQAVGQVDPTSIEPIEFTAIFSEPVIGFTATDVDVSGTASAGVSVGVSGGPTVFTVSIMGATVDGTIIADIPADATTDGTNTSNASVSVDNTVTWAQGVAGVTDHFTVTAAASTTAGTVKMVTVTAKDFTNATVMTYGGTVHITSSDGAAQLPANATLTNGVGTFAVILKTAGSQTVTATDTVVATITGTTPGITVNPAVTTKYTVVIPASPSVGAATTATVTAKDTYNNTTPAYAGTVKFTSTDGAAALPGNSTLASGVGSFPVTFNNPGAQTVTATDFNSAAITGVSNTVTVLAAPATHFSVTTGASTTAGAAISVTVQALDASNAATTNYSGMVHFTSTDGAATLPADAALVNGFGVFPVTLTTAGNATVTATDTVAPSITGTTSTIAVSAAAATHFSVAAPATATNGSAITVTVTALDQFDNTATGYAGTVHFTSTDGAATLPADTTLVNGVGTPQATLNTNGNQTLTATDTVTASITGTSGAINVSDAPPPPATHFMVTGAASATAGASFSVTVTALDAGNAATTGYSGTVHFTSSDGAATLPADATLVNGVGMFSVTLFTAGVQTVTATDTVTVSITGTTSGTTVSAAAADHFTVSTPATATAGLQISTVVTAEDVYGNTATGYAGSVDITSTDGAAALPAANTLTNGVGSFPVTLNTLGNQTVTATDSVSSAITGTSNTIDVSNLPPAPATHFSVSAPASAVAGTAFSITVTALDAGSSTANGYSGTVHFTSTSAGTLPADVALVNGVGVVSATLTASGNQTITATDIASSSITGTSNTIAVAAAPAAKFQISTLVFVQVTTFSSTLRTAAAGGHQYNFNVTALDQFDNVATGYNGTVHFSSDDPTAELPADSALGNGVGAFTVTFHTPGTHSVSVADPANPAIAGAHSPGVVVAADPVTPTTSTVPTLPTLPTTPTTASRPVATPLPATGTDAASIVLLAACAILTGGAIAMSRSRRGRARVSVGRGHP